MSVPSVVQTDSDSFCVENDNESSIYPSESASLDVTSDSAKVPPPNLRSALESEVATFTVVAKVAVAEEKVIEERSVVLRR